MAPRKAAPKHARASANRVASRLERATAAAITLFHQEETPFALIGGIAIGLRAAPRATVDVDFAIALDHAGAEHLIHVFGQSGFRVAAVLVTKRDERLATVRMRHEHSKTIIDLLISFCGIEREIVRAATAERWRKLTLPVVTLGHLVAMKLLANRLQDQADLESLLREITPVERRWALNAIGRIQRLGLGDGRDLVGELKSLLAPPRRGPDTRFEVQEVGKRFGPQTRPERP